MKKNPLQIGRLAMALLTVVSVSLLASCSKSNDYNWWDEEEEEVKVKESVTVTVEQGDGSSSTIPEGSTLGYFVISSDGTSSVSNDHVTVGEGGQTSFSTTAAGTYIVYSPYQEGWEDAMQNPPVFQVQSNQSSEANYDASDLMAGTMTVGSATRADNAGNLTMKHLLAKLYIRIIDDTGLIDFRTDGTLRLFDMRDAVSVYLTELRVETLPDSSSDIDMLAYERTDRRMMAAAIVAPQTVGDERDLFVLNVGGQQLTYRQKVALESGLGLALVIRFTKDGLKLDGTYIINWTASGSDIEIETLE